MKLRQMPGPRTWSLFGHLFELRRDLLEFLSKVTHKYGDITYFRIGLIRVVLLNRPDYIKEILQTNDQNFVKGLPLRLAKRLLGEGLLTSEGKLHARQSRIVQPALHLNRIHSFGKIMTDYALKCSDEWKEGATVDMTNEMTRLSMSIAGKTMFNWDVGTLDANGITAALNDAMKLFPRVSIPFSEQLLKIPIPSTRRFYQAKAHLDSTIYGLINERRKVGENLGDLLSMLLKAQDETDGKKMSDVQVRDEALTLFLTGLDTVSLALTWTWYLISQNPDIESKLHTELDSVLAGKTPSIEDIEKLPYTRNIFLEALRLYPPIYAIAREAVDTFSLGGYTIPGKTLILMSPYLMHRDYRYYQEPERFDPDRWNLKTANKSPRFSFFPFGGGPRGCIGQSYALQEAILILATLAQGWRMRLVPGHRVELLPLINLRPKFGMRMVLERRHKSTIKRASKTPTGRSSSST